MVRRRQNDQSLRKRVLILCEGVTEEKYFKGIKTDEEHKRKFTAVDINIYQPDDYSPLGLAEEAIKKKKEAEREKNPYNSIWIVFDRDRHEGINETWRLAGSKGLKICYSAICFEYWILLHFENTSRSFRKCDRLISYIKTNHDSDYEKASNQYKRLKHSTEVAIKRGKVISNNIPPDTKPSDLSAFTNVYELVEYLINL